MKNGTELIAFIEETVTFLADRQVIDYYREALPSPTDKRMANICGRFMALTPGKRESFMAALDRRHRSLLGIYGHRAATLSVRQESRQQLLNGLVAMAMANYVVEKGRNIEVGLAVHHHCAVKLDINPVDIFDEAAQYAQPEVADLMERFGRRADVRLRHFGWQELKTPEGVKYKFEF